MMDHSPQLTLAERVLSRELMRFILASVKENSAQIWEGSFEVKAALHFCRAALNPCLSLRRSKHSARLISLSGLF